MRSSDDLLAQACPLAGSAIQRAPVAEIDNWSQLFLGSHDPMSVGGR
jgi:hypothetical protein